MINDKTLEAVMGNVTETLTGNMLDFTLANQLLTSTVIKYLSEKGVIEIDEYLDFNKTMQDRIIGRYDEDGSISKDKKDSLQYIFELHRDSLSAPKD